MRKRMLRLWLVGSVLLSFQTSAQQAGAHRQTIWKTNMDAARSFEEAVNLIREIHEANKQTGLPANFHYHMKEWTQQDVTVFAQCDKTFNFFETVLGITNAALEKDKTGNFTEDAIEAQTALAYLKPDGCKSWVGFAKMIAYASGQTEILRAKYHKDMATRKNGAK